MTKNVKKAVGILSSRWQQGAGDERGRKVGGQGERSDATLFSPLHDLFIFL